jgi:hypothetical protein
MFAVVERWLGPLPYAQKVAKALFREGFDPTPLDEMKTLGSFTQGSRLFQILAQYKLRPVDAALALRLACRRYQETRFVAEANGWPLKPGRERAHPPHEAYFLELLDEAAESLRAQ